MLVNDPAKTRRETIIVACVLALLQLALAPNVGIGSGRANLALVFVAYACFGGNAQTAPIYGFASGLFFDLATTGPIGLMALILTLVGWGLSLTGRSRISDDFGGSVAFFIPVAAAVSFIYAVVLMATGQVSSILEAFVFKALPEIFLNVLCFAILAAALSRFSGQSSRLGGPKHGSKSSLSLKRGL